MTMASASRDGHIDAIARGTTHSEKPDHHEVRRRTSG